MGNWAEVFWAGVPDFQHELAAKEERARSVASKPCRQL